MSIMGKSYDPNTVVITGLPERRKPVPWNRRYLAYCRSQGHPDPAKMLASDREKWPGGSMTGFILWSNERIAEFLRENPQHKMNGSLRNVGAHEAYDAWLLVKYPIVG